MPRYIFFIFAFFLFIQDIFAYRVTNGAWVTIYRTDEYYNGYYYRIYNGCGADVWMPENTSSDFYRATTSNVRPSCIRVHKVMYPGSGITPCPTGSTVLRESDWSTRMSLNSSQPFTSGEMRCDFLP